ncbi:MAG TPA: tripartite tricarboxylate transporter substrate binding protein, partial [Burkholderiales bacterium]|nr:tripartite tricarboxylate transporter substrate binding protein [Burkholderiales bacterium]
MSDSGAIMRAAICFLLVLVSSSLLAAGAERAFPIKPIRLISSYPPGGGNDAVARAIAAKLTDAWGQQVIVDNRPGANGLLACEITAKAAPDGYTLLMASIATHAINPALYKKIPYDPIRDFAPVTLLGSTANVLVVHPSIPVKTVKELVAYARSKPGLTYGSNGIGSSQHLAGALFATSFGLKLVHVPYKGTGPMMNELLGGQIALSFANSLAVVPNVRAKRLVPLAVTSLTRSAALPELPTLAETVPGFEVISWWGIVVPAATPPAIINTLNQEIVKGLNAPDMKSFMNGLGAEPRPMTPQEFAAFIRSEHTKWARV